MRHLLAAFIFLASSILASPPNFCGVNLSGQYFISLNATLQVNAASVCRAVGLDLAHLQVANVSSLVNIGNSCLGGNKTYWFEVFETMAPPFNCWYFTGNGTVGSYGQACLNTLGYPVCQLFPTTVSLTLTSSFTSATTTSVIGTVTTTSVTTFNGIVKITDTIVDIESFTQTVTKTSITVSTVRCPGRGCRQHHNHNHHSDDDSSSSSRKQIKLMEKRVDTYSACNFSGNNFFFVSVSGGPLVNDWRQLACANFGFNLANITALDPGSLKVIQGLCSVGDYSFNYYNAYQPACGQILASGDRLQMFPDLSIPGVSSCLLPGGVLCHSGTPQSASTFTTNTSPTTFFTSSTMTITTSTTVVQVVSVTSTSLIKSTVNLQTTSGTTTTTVISSTPIKTVSITSVWTRYKFPRRF